MPPSARALVPRRSPNFSAAVRPLSSFSSVAPCRNLSSSSSSRSSSPPASSTPAPSSAPNPRWLSDIKSRLGKCITFGCNPGEETELAAKIAGTIAREWRGFVAGAEGFHITDVPGKETRPPRQEAGLEPDESRRTGNAWVEGVRWGDMDSMGHVNNASYLRYAEISRIHYFRRLARFIPASRDSSARQVAWLRLWTPHSVGLIYKHAAVDFLLPVTFPDRLTLCHRLADNFPGQGDEVDFIPLNVVALSNKWQRNAVRVYEEIAVFDYRLGKRTKMEAWMVEVLRAAQSEEKRCRVEWGRRRDEIEGWVGQLEERTWASGRAEDMG